MSSPDEMTPEQVIRAAWPKAVRNWKRSKHGSCCRVPVQKPIQYGPWVDPAPRYEKPECVEFRIDAFGHIFGSFKGEEVQVQ